MEKIIIMSSFYNNYYQKLKDAFESKGQSTIFNNDRMHNATIMCFMLDHCNKINMYCGEMSVLREKFYDKIEEKERNEFKERISDKITRFLSEEGKQFNIIVENYDVDNANDLICKDVIRDGIKNKKISIKCLKDSYPYKGNSDHFCIADEKMVRLEIDKEDHTAMCVFNDTDYTKLFTESFAKLNNYSETRSI